MLTFAFYEANFTFNVTDGCLLEQRTGTFC